MILPDLFPGPSDAVSSAPAVPLVKPRLNVGVPPMAVPEPSMVVAGPPVIVPGPPVVVPGPPMFLKGPSVLPAGPPPGAHILSGGPAILSGLTATGLSPGKSTGA